MSNARPAPLEQSLRRSVGTAIPRAGTPAKSLPVLETTTSGRESRAPDADNILVHAGERTQSLYEVWPIPSCPANSPVATGPIAHATTLRLNKYSRSRRSASDPARTPSRDASIAPIPHEVPFQ